MSPIQNHRYSVALWACLAALVASAAITRAAKPEWAGGTGNANQNEKWVNDTPGNSGAAKIAKGKVTFDTVTILTSLELTYTADTSGNVLETGAIDGTATLKLTGSDANGSLWDAGTMSFSGGGGTEVDASATLVIGTVNDKRLAGGSLKNKGNSSWTGGALKVSNGATLVNDGGTFTTNFDGIVQNEGGAGTFTNSGTFEKNGGAGGATDIQIRFESTGQINASAGRLKLSGGGASSNAVTLSNGAKLEVAGANFDFNGGILNSDSGGAIEVSSAVATFAGTTGSANLDVTGSGTAKVNGSHTTTGKVSISGGGKLEATSVTDTVTVGGLDWTGGEITTGIFNATGASLITAGEAKKLHTGAKLGLAGITDWTGGEIETGTAEINNTGTFNAKFDGKISNSLGGSATFKNNGTFKKTDASNGTTEIASAFVNEGDGANVVVDAGTLKLSGGGSSAKAINLGGTSKLEIAGQNFSFSGGALDSTADAGIEVTGVIATFGGTTGSANLDLDEGGTAKINGTHQTSGKVRLNGTGKIDGVTTTSIATVGALEWNGGEINTAKVVSSGTTIGGTDEKKIQNNGKLSLGGTTQWTGGEIQTGGSAEITNTGTFNATFDGTISNGLIGSATFKNNGTFKKTDASNGTTEIATAFVNEGDGANVVVDAGTLKLSGGGSSAKTINLGGSSRLQIAGQNFSFNGGALDSTSDAGIEVIGVIATFGGTTGSANLDLDDSGTAKINGTHQTSGKVRLNGTGKIDGVTTTSIATVGALEWNGGEINTAKVVSSGTTIGGADEKKIQNNGKLSLGGTTQWTGGEIQTGGSAEITNTGIFNATFDGTISNGLVGSATFKNNGTFKKTSDSNGTTEIATAFVNEGDGANVVVDAGTLKLSGGGSSAKAINLGGSSRLQIAGQNFSFTGGALDSTADGVIDVSGVTATFGGTTGSANLDLDNSGTAKINGTHQTSGTVRLNGTGKIDGVTTTSIATVGTLEWNGGEINTAKVVSSGTTIGGTDEKKIQNNGKLSLGGTTQWTGGEIQTGGSAEITNTGTFNATFDGTISNGLVGSATFKNNGTFKKTGASNGTTEIATAFVNEGDGANVVVDAGTLKLSGGGSSAKAINLGGSSRLQIAGQNFSFTGGALDSTAEGVIDVSGVTATFGGTTGSANLDLDDSGTAKINGTHQTSGKVRLNGTGKIDGVTTTSIATVGALEWNGGEINTAKVVSSGTTIGGADEKKIQNNGKLSLGGTTQWTGGEIQTGGSAEITNTGTFNATFDGTISNGLIGSATFKNNGTFKKTSDSHGTTEIATAFVNEGDGANVVVDAGTLKLSGGGSSAKAINLGGSSRLQIAGQNFSFNGGALDSTADAGIEVTGVIATFGGTTGSANLDVVEGGTAKINGTHQTSGKVRLDGTGKIDGVTTTSIATVGALEWNGGEIVTASITSGATTIAGGSKKIHGNGKLSLGGLTDWTGGEIETGGSAEIVNAGDFNVRFNGKISTALGGGATFKNNGTFKKTDDADGETEIAAVFENNGDNSSIAIDAGTLKLTGGGSSSRGINMAGNAKLKITGSGFIFGGGEINGEGEIELADSITTFAGTSGNAKLAVTGGTARFGGDHNGNGHLHLASGKVDGAGNAKFGSLAWDSGDIVDATIETSGASITGQGGKFLKGAKLKLAGETTWDGSELGTESGAEITNEGNFTTNGAGKITHVTGARGSFKNNGYFERGGVGTETAIETIFENASFVNVASGKLKLSAGGRNKAGAGIDVAALAQLDIDGDLTLEELSELKGKGLARLVAGKLDANSTIDIEQFDFEGGQLGGTHTFKGNVNWKGGDWSLAGSTTIEVGGVLNLERGDAHAFKGRSIFNHGTINWKSGNLQGGEGSEIVNASHFNDGSDGVAGNKTVLAPGILNGTFTFTNNGTYRKRGSGTTTVEIPFANNETLRVEAGTLHFKDSFTQGGGALIIAAGATAQFDHDIEIGEGTLGGSGTIAGNVVNSGVFSPGSSPGTFNITGNLTLAASSVALFEIGGTSSGVDHDFVAVSGAAQVGGELELKFVFDFHTTITGDDEFVLMTANGPGGLTGLFTNVANGQRLFTIDGLGSFKVNYGLESALGTNSLVLTDFAAVPEPSTWALLIGGLGLIALVVRRRRA